MRYWWLRSPSKLSTVSTICSSTRGPAIVPSLVTWPTSTTAVPRSLAKRTSSCAEARTWLTVPGAPSIRSRMHGLDRIDDQQRRRLAFAERGQDVAHRGRRREPHRRLAEPEPDRAQPHLLGRFLARDIDDAAGPSSASRRRDLEQQGRLADAGIAADQHRRARHDPAADRAVELGDPARQPLGQRDRRCRARPARSSARRPGDCAWRRRCSTPRRASWTSVFHSAQSAHWPCQRVETEPQAWQT